MSAAEAETVTRVRLYRRAAALIEAKPGVSEGWLVDALTREGFGFVGELGAGLRVLGCRPVKHPDFDGRTWWPSRRRCAELARGAQPGPLREALMQGMLL